MFKWILSRMLHFSRNLKDENKLDSLARRNLCYYNLSPTEKNLVIFSPMNLDKFCCKIVSVTYSHCEMIVNMVKELLFSKTDFYLG